MKGGRSVQGCWTCRLRRKKCDEAIPICFACDSRNIHCHGYGLRPEWMDGGERERAELARIKHGVKRNRRQKRQRAQQLHAAVREQAVQSTILREPAVEDGTGDGSQGIEIEIDPHESTATASYPLGGHPNLSPQDGASPFYSDQRSLQATVATPSVVGGQALEAESPSQYHSLLSQTTLPPLRILHHREAELLMHYLDHVFHLQFRFHSPSVRTGGRGWLLWLLIRTGPLYHAALSLSALHQHVLLHQKDSAPLSPTGDYSSSTLHELNEYHGRTLQELQVCLQNSQTDAGNPDLGRQIEILACGVQLISFQLFQGGVSDWQMHVNAVAALISSIEDDRQSRLEDSGPITGHAVSPGCSSAPSSEEAALEFLSTVVIWFDIAACASTGTAPRLLHHHPTLLGSGRADLANVMGCRSWAMETIGQIAALSAWKDARVADGEGVSVWELVERGRGIQTRLESGIATLEAEAEMGDHHDSTTAIQRAITNAFACAAQVYLHVTVSGAHPSLPEIKRSVSQTVSALHAVIRVSNDRQSIRGVIWPICVAGCMADPESGLEDVFRSLIVDMGDAAREFGNSSTVLAVMEKCWEMRRANAKGEGRGPWEWRRAMECLGVRAFLI